jgi:predicted nucleotidyltransferase
MRGDTPALTSAEQEAVDAHTQALRDVFGQRLERVILFGSRARGDAHAESDIDVMAVLSGAVGLADICTAARAAVQVLVDTGIYIEALLLSHDEYEHPEGQLSYLVRAAQREGVAL